MILRFAPPLVALSLLAPALARADFAYPTFASTSGLGLVGNAAPSGTALRLVPALNDQVGAAWYNAPQYVAKGFDTTFAFAIDGGTGADGLAFALQDAGTAAIGARGADVGFQGLAANKAGALFRSFLYNQIELDQGSQALAVAPAQAIRGAHTARVLYVPGTMSLFYDGATAPTVTAPLDLASLFAATGGYATVGFTAATGGATDNHDLLSWSFRSQAAPEPSALAALGLGSLALLRRRRKA